MADKKLFPYNAATLKAENDTPCFGGRIGSCHEREDGKDVFEILNSIAGKPGLFEQVFKIKKKEEK